MAHTALAIVLTLLVALPFAAGVGLPTPPGGGSSDPWLDASGDTLQGELTIGPNALDFHGIALRSKTPGELSYGGTLRVDALSLPPSTRTLGLHPVAFAGGGSDLYFDADGHLHRAIGADKPRVLVAPLQLPRFSEITAVEVHFEGAGVCALLTLQIVAQDASTGTRTARDLNCEDSYSTFELHGALLLDGSITSMQGLFNDSELEMASQPLRLLGARVTYVVQEA